MPPSDDLATITRIIRGRRTIKPFDMDPAREIDRGMLLSLLGNANHAPTHGLTEPWRFHIFQGDARGDLSAAMRRIYRDTTPAIEFREEKLRKMAENPLLAPVAIAWCFQRGGGEKVPEIEEIEAAACAAQNFFLSATAAGLASSWSSPPLVYTPEFSAWLGLEPDERCLGLVYAGWPRAGLVQPEKTRRALSQKIRWHGSAA